MHGADRHTSRPMGPGGGRKILERAKVAEAPVACPAQAIKLHSQRPGPAAHGIRHRPAARGRHSQYRLLRSGLQRVIADHIDAGQHAVRNRQIDRAATVQRDLDHAVRQRQAHGRVLRGSIERQQTVRVLRLMQAVGDRSV